MHKQSSYPALARMVAGGAIGGYVGNRYGKSESDNSPTGRFAGGVVGTLGGALAGLGVHGARRALTGLGAQGLSGLTARNTLGGLMGIGAAAGAGHLSGKLGKKMFPDSFRPDYLTQKDRRTNIDITTLAQRYKDAGGNFSRMSQGDAARLQALLTSPETKASTEEAIRRRFSDMYPTKIASYYQPTEMDLTNAAYHMQLRRALALRQLMAMQQMQQQQQQGLQYMGSANSPEEAATKLRSIIQQAQPNQQQPTEEQARSMINQYMQAAGVDTESSKAQKAADKYDTPTPKKETKSKKSKQKPFKVKAESKKTASMSLADVNKLEKVAGSTYPTYYHRDGSISKDINGVEHVFSPSGMLKTANVFSRALNAYRGLGALGKGGVIGSGLLAAGGLGYGGKKLYDYYTRPPEKTFGEKLVAGGAAALPHIIKSVQAYNAMKDQLANMADPNANLVMRDQPQNPVMVGLGMDAESQRAGAPFVQRQMQELGIPPYASPTQVSQFDPRMQQAAPMGYQDIR